MVVALFRGKARALSLLLTSSRIFNNPFIWLGHLSAFRASVSLPTFDRYTICEMAASRKDEMPMLLDTDSRMDGHEDSQPWGLPANIPRASNSIPMYSSEPCWNDNILVGYTGPLRNEKRTPFTQRSGPLYINRNHENLLQPTQCAIQCKITDSSVEKYPSINGHNNHLPDNNAGKNEHLLRSGPLGMCNDPYCTSCPTYFTEQQKKTNSSVIFDAKFRNILYGDAKGWATRVFSFLQSCIPGVMNPHTSVVQKWNKFFVISCLMAIFLDPLFFFLLSVQQDYKCIVLNWPMTKTFVVLRSITDFIYFLHILLQFRLAYIAPESRVMGAGDLVDHPKKIAFHYLSGCFLIDFLVVLPLPQIIILVVMGSSGANDAKNSLRVAVLVQYIPRLCRCLPLLAGQSSSGFIFESAWANFVINLLTFVLSGHVVGSCWYLLGFQRVNQCLRDACHSSYLDKCMKLIDCGHGNAKSFSMPDRSVWKNNTNATACFDKNGFSYGIYEQTVNLTTKHSIATRYVYSLFWGFQQISTLAGNQIPSYFIWEVLFTMGIIGLGLLLFALLIGNMQNFLQALGRRGLEMSLRRRDFELWMSRRCLPEDLRRQVRQSERYNWAATSGVNEEMLLANLPEDLQREIRRHLFKFVKKVGIFSIMDENMLDAICERLRQKTYTKGSKILYPGVFIEKMFFIVRGKMESIGEDGTVYCLFEGDVCGEELLTWCLEHSSVNKDGRKVRIPGHRLLSTRTVRCLTNTEAFTLRAADLEEVTGLFARILRNQRVQRTIRYMSPYWRGHAARRIQVAWRYRKKCLSRADASDAPNTHTSTK